MKEDIRGKKEGRRRKMIGREREEGKREGRETECGIEDEERRREGGGKRRHEFLVLKVC